MAEATSALDLSLRDARLVAVCVATTGFDTRTDRIVELAVTVVPDREADEPAVLVDTLVDPRRPVKLTELHGIRPVDVEGAPTFDRIALAVAEARGSD